MKIFVIKKNQLILHLLFICILALGLFGFDTNKVKTVSSGHTYKKNIPIYCVDTKEKVVSLTFNAAWGNEDIDQLINILSKYNIKTTFFIVGDWADRYPESVKKLSNAGHEIMNHSNTHPHMSQLTAEKIREDVKKCDNKIEAITGKRPFLFRAPYGEYNDLVIKTVNEMGHYAIQWDVDSLDWKNISEEAIFERVINGVKKGSIVLFHAGTKYTAGVLPKIIETLQQQGYKVVPVSEMIYKKDYYINHLGKQIPLDTPAS